MRLIVLLKVVTFLVGQCSGVDNGACPTWLYLSEKGWCTCGSSVHDVMTCDNETQEVSIRRSFCLTSFDGDTSKAVIGSCLFAQHHGHGADSDKGLYIKVNGNLSQQDQQLCGYVNREGQLCGRCRSNHYMSAYSYDFKCHQCHNGHTIANAVVYFTVAFFPVTLFLVAVVSLHISVSSPHLNIPILLCQLYSLPDMVWVFLQNTRGTNLEVFVSFVETVYGIWNLDFFRAIIPPICLPLTTMQVIALDYLVAAYPLFLLVCFYVLVTAHDRGCRLVVRLWRPFLWCSARIRQQWNIRHSIIDAFATFLILAYIKFLTTSFDLLITTEVLNIHGSEVGYFLYYDATVEFMDPQHMPYFIIAIIILVFTIMFPVLLILYPMKWFQVFLNKCHLNSPGLRMFMECFQGYYRDRSDGGRECRYFAAVYPMLRIVATSLYGLTHNKLFFALAIVILIGVVAIILVVRPYKKQQDIYNKLDAIFLMTMVVFCASVLIHDFSFELFVVSPDIVGKSLGGLCLLAPMVYFTSQILKNMRHSSHISKFCVYSRNGRELIIRT